MEVTRAQFFLGELKHWEISSQVQFSQLESENLLLECSEEGKLRDISLKVYWVDESRNVASVEWHPDRKSQDQRWAANWIEVEWSRRETRRRK